MNEGIRPLEKKKDVPEGKENAELFRATLGFDFIFTKDAKGSRKCVCIEINGDNAGILGIQDIPDDKIDKTKKIVANIRSTYNPKYMQRRGVIMDLASGEFPATPEGRAKIAAYYLERKDDTRLFEHSFKNPKHIRPLPVTNCFSIRLHRKRTGRACITVVNRRNRRPGIGFANLERVREEKEF